MSEKGWPFLVAAGRRHEYRVLLAPDFLVDELDYGILEEVVGLGSEHDPARIVSVNSPGGRRLTLAYATHLLDARDIAEPGGLTHGHHAEPRDEHGRPLRLGYGFAVRAGSITNLAQYDIDVAREAALTVYRQFLHDEERFSVVPSDSFLVRSRISAQESTSVRTGAVRETGIAPRKSGFTRRYGLICLALAVVVAVLAVAAECLRSSPAPHPDCVGQTRMTVRPPTPSTGSPGLGSASLGKGRNASSSKRSGSPTPERCPEATSNP